MRILRLYLNNQLDLSVNWTLVDNEAIIETGSLFLSTFSGFDNVQIEVYLNASCCSIFKTSKVGSISRGRLTDELILGLIEEELVDDIDALKPILLQAEDNLAYIAIFNRDFYEQLILQLLQLDRPIKLVQSYVYSTSHKPDSNQWTLYLSPEQNFIRTSGLQYYLLDDAQPLPKLFEDMLLNSVDKPKEVVVYSELTHDLAAYTERFGIPFVYSTTPLEFGVPVWNFYKQNSSTLKLKIEPSTKVAVANLLKTVKYFALMLTLFWVVNVINLRINTSKAERALKTGLEKIMKVDKINPAVLDAFATKLTDLTHERGLYMETDFVPLLAKFLKVASATDPDDITQLDYNKNAATLTVFLRAFPTNQFQNYRDILKSQHIIAELVPYRQYAKAHKSKELGSRRGARSTYDRTAEDQPLNNDTKLVLTLRMAWSYEAL